MDDKETKVPTLDGEIVELVKGLPLTAGKVVLEEYRKGIPFVVKEAIDEFYVAMAGIKDKDSISVLNKSLKALKNACEANPAYEEIYEAAQKEAKESVADIVVNEGLTLFDV